MDLHYADSDMADVRDPERPGYLDPRQQLDDDDIPKEVFSPKPDPSSPAAAEERWTKAKRAGKR